MGHVTQSVHIHVFILWLNIFTLFAFYWKQICFHNKERSLFSLKVIVLWMYSHMVVEYFYSDDNIGIVLQVDQNCSMRHYSPQ